jgi:hypothetical protein
MSRFGLAPLAVLFTLTSTLLSAQSLVGEPEFIRVQRQAIAQDREVVLSAYELAAKACWQKFSVNHCLSDARKARRAALEPLRQQDLVLNTQERLWRTEQRDLRLQGKQPDEPSPP